MEVLAQPAVNVLDNFKNIKACKPSSRIFTTIPVVDFHGPEAKMKIVEACKKFGLFKVINHGVPMEFMTKLECEAVKFFNLPQPDKEKSGPPNPYGYGNKKIGCNGYVGWLEYLIFGQEIVSHNAQFILPGVSQSLWSLVNDYVSAVRDMMCRVLEMIAEELKIGPKDILSRLIRDKESDSCFRLNHYPPCSELQSLSGRVLIGFGEHTDPQLLSVARSNNTSGLQVCLKDGTWVSIPPDQSSFFFNVGDSLQVMTNGRFQSVKHRVLAHGLKSRASMIYLGGPPLSEMITPMTSLMEDGEEKLYEEFTWSEYKKSVYKTRLGENRLRLFKKSTSQ